MGQHSGRDKAKETIDTILKDYRIHLKSKEIRSHKSFIAQLNLFFSWCDQQGIHPLNINQEEAKEWLISLMEGEKPLSRKTINLKLSILKGFYTYLQRRGNIYHSPFFYIKALKLGLKLPRDIPQPEELEKLLNNFSIMSLHDEMLKTIIEILYGSGLRISEVITLKQEDIDWIGGSFTIYEKKTLKNRRVPASDAALLSLQRYCRDLREPLLPISELQAGYLFPQQAMGTIRSRLNNRLKRECTRLDIPLLTSHSFRHAAATHMLKAGAGIRQVQSFLGHESISSTEVYTHLIKEDLKEVIHNHHPREKRSRP